MSERSPAGVALELSWSSRGGKPWLAPVSGWVVSAVGGPANPHYPDQSTGEDPHGMGVSGPRERAFR